MSTVTSKDGTSIAYTRRGIGPAVILATGALDDGSENAPLAADLASDFTTYNYNRRGRGESGDNQQYSLQREIEDLEALIAEAGGSAHLYGVSSGGALILEASAAGLSAGKLAVYEIPYMTDEEAVQVWQAYVAQLQTALAERRRGDAGELFMRLAGSSQEQIAEARHSHHWPGVEILAHTLAYDAACLGGGEPPTDRLATIGHPTLVITGGGNPLFETSADAIAASIPNSQRLTLEGQGHVVDPTVMASQLRRFFGGDED